MLKFIFEESPVMLVRLVIDLLHYFDSFVNVRFSKWLLFFNNMLRCFRDFDSHDGSVLLELSSDFFLHLLGKHVISSLDFAAIRCRSRNFVLQCHDLFDQVLVVVSDRHEELVLRGHNFAIDS